MALNPDLEAAIDRAGRIDVFLLAEAYGWSPMSPPPEWVWWGIVREVEARHD